MLFANFLCLWCTLGPFCIGPFTIHKLYIQEEKEKGTRRDGVRGKGERGAVASVLQNGGGTWVVLVASLGLRGGCKETSSRAGLLRERKLGREVTTCTGEE